MFSQQVTDSTVRHAVYLEGLKTSEVKKFAEFLRQIDASIRSRLAGEDLTAYSRARLERLLASTQADLRGIMDAYQSQMQLDLGDLATYEAGFEARNLSQVGFEAVTPSPLQVKSAVFARPLSVRGANGGKLLTPFITDWTRVEADRVSGAIRQGFYEGRTTPQIMRDIRGTRANKYTDGILAITSRNAEAITRTSVQHAASVARMETWKANEGIVVGYKWLATLDSRTGDICRALDGQVFAFDKGPLPPAHIRCRSTTLAELDDQYKFLDEGSTRAAGAGDVGANETYYSWLKKQPVEFQNDIIGPKRGKLLRDGGLSAKRFSELQLDKTFRPLTLAEMRKKEPLAFRKAFD